MSFLPKQRLKENTVYNIGSAFDSTLISNMNIGYYQFCADSDSTLQKGMPLIYDKFCQIASLDLEGYDSIYFVFQSHLSICIPNCRTKANLIANLSICITNSPLSFDFQCLYRIEGNYTVLYLRYTNISADFFCLLNTCIICRSFEL
ncbi:uncharacterized protein LOC126593392 isoform X2 [Malus sylvestris]|uniref:uncharacterized protein LOC126593392 isoform X2 n=1 Tax=Malus sylvestris TaxID=3752 RepID=UPI0021AC415E|nr:uncharacterized protein LOC126593392 isoform X2 [Malus sylvestris]